MLNFTVGRLMTCTPHAVGHDEPLASAHQLMRYYDVRYMPVIESGKLVGLLAQRDLHLLENLPQIDTELVTVREVMSVDIYCVSPITSAGDVAGEMIVHRYAAAVVIEQSRPVGVFTIMDALSASYGALSPTARRLGKQRERRG